jgi:hypothetical protein
MTDRWIEDQIAREREELANVAKIPVAQLRPKTGAHGRCGFCGRVSTNLVLVEVTHGVERYKGDCCNGVTR